MSRFLPLQPNGNEFAETLPGPIWKAPPADDDERHERRRIELWIILVLRPQLFDLFEDLDECRPILRATSVGAPRAPLGRMLDVMLDEIAPMPRPRFKVTSVDGHRFKVEVKL